MACVWHKQEQIVVRIVADFSELTSTSSLIEKGVGGPVNPEDGF